MRLRTCWIGGVVLSLVGISALVWIQKDALWVWWQSRNLESATPLELEKAVDRLAAFEPIAVPALIRQLSSSDARLCASSGAALGHLLQRHAADESRTQKVLSVLADRFAHCSAEGRNQVLLIVSERLRATGEVLPPVLLETCARLVQASANVPAENRLAALQLVHELLVTAEAERILPASRPLVLAGLKSANLAERLLAVRLAATPVLDLLQELPALVTGVDADSSAEVRILVLLSLGSREQLLPTELILPMLNDADAELRSVAERALKTRGLSGAQIRLAQMLTHPDAGVRARVPELVNELPELDATLWLERLSRDPCPSVRVAVLRNAEARPEECWQQSVRRIRQSDPSPTVKDIAKFCEQARFDTRDR